MQRIMNAMMALDRIRTGTRAVIHSFIAATTSPGAVDGATPLVSDGLKHGNHVIGHSEGLGTSNPPLGTALLQRLENVGWLSGFAEQRSILNQVWSSFGAWKDAEVLEPLLEFIKLSYRLCGVDWRGGLVGYEQAQCHASHEHDLAQKRSKFPDGVFEQWKVGIRH